MVASSEPRQLGLPFPTSFNPMIQLVVKRHNQEPKTYEYERLMHASNHRKIEHQTLDTLICTEIWLDGDLISVAG